MVSKKVLLDYINDLDEAISTLCVRVSGLEAKLEKVQKKAKITETKTKKKTKK